MMASRMSDHECSLSQSQNCKQPKCGQSKQLRGNRSIPTVEAIRPLYSVLPLPVGILVESMEIFLHALGFAMLWFIGLFIISILLAIAYVFFIKPDADKAQVVFIVGMILWVICSAIGLLLV